MATNEDCANQPLNPLKQSPYNSHQMHVAISYSMPLGSVLAVICTRELRVQYYTVIQIGGRTCFIEVRLTSTWHQAKLTKPLVRLNVTTGRNTNRYKCSLWANQLAYNKDPPPYKASNSCSILRKMPDLPAMLHTEIPLANIARPVTIPTQGICRMVTSVTVCVWLQRGHFSPRLWWPWSRSTNVRSLFRTFRM